MSQTTITCVRHPKSNPAAGPTHTDEMARRHSDIGIEQAQARLVALGGVRPYTLVLSSPAERCTQLAAVLSGMDEAKITTLQALTIEDKAESEHAAVLDALFTELMYAPLRTYRAHEKGDALRKVGEDGRNAVMELLGDLPDGAQVLVTGHAVFLNALVLAIVGDDSPYADLILDYQIPEAGGFQIVVEDGKVTEVTTLP